MFASLWPYFLGEGVPEPIPVDTDTPLFRIGGARLRLKQEWYTCDRCGMAYPRAKVVVQNGLLLCNGTGTSGCMDEPGAEAPRRHIRPVEREIAPLPHIEEDL